MCECVLEHECVSASMYMPHWWTTQKRFEKDLVIFFTKLYVIQSAIQWCYCHQVRWTFNWHITFDVGPL